MDGTEKIGGGASGHGDQRTGKNTAPFFSGSGVLCKVDSPFNLLCFCMLLLREDIHSTNYTLCAYTVEGQKFFGQTSINPNIKELVKYLDILNVQ